MLVADIGNTDILFGVFDSSTLIDTYRIPSKKKENALFFEYTLQNFFLENNISAELLNQAVLSSVVPELTDTIAEMLSLITGQTTIVVKSDIHPDVKVCIDDPEELGTDLYANAVYAFSKYASACIIVDFGTALTFTAVSAKGEVLGVSIAPGLKTAVHALFSKTSQLPHVPLELPEKAIGTNSLKSIQSGVLIGYEGLVKNLLTKIKQEIGTECKVLATGGLSSILSGLKDEFDEVDVHLTINGLRIIGEALRA
ncbi:MAG: type III pantothenate kinase [Arcticibacterium sp.]|jgi:type III pantothenate kinase